MTRESEGLKQQLELERGRVQQLEAIAPPVLLRMASGEGPTRWVPGIDTDTS